MRSSPLLAIFVGGKSRRMGTPKGRLPVEPGGEPILEAQVREGRLSGLDVVLVGQAHPYDSLVAGVPRLDDDPRDAGPLGGLRAALAHGSRRGHRSVIAVACDMPYVTRPVLLEVIDAPSARDAAVLAPRRGPDAPWEPMLARYEAARVLPVLDAALDEGVRSFQALFARLRVHALELTPRLEEALADWDTPDDVPR